MSDEMHWDHEVDVLCIGSEGGALAAGLVAMNAGLDAYVGISRRAGASCDLAAFVGAEDPDGQTSAYLRGFNYAFGRAESAQADVPVRTVEDIAPPQRGPRDRGAVEPFFGATLEPWARHCATAAHGLLYNRVSSRQMTEMRSSRGETIEAAVVGSLALNPDRPAPSLMRWLKMQASSAGLRPQADVRLENLVFEEGEVVGAVLVTPEGPQTVRARQNVVIGLGDPHADGLQPRVSGTESVTVHICLVTKKASRFGQLELVTADESADRISVVPAPNAERYAGSQRAISA